MAVALTPPESRINVGDNVVVSIGRSERIGKVVKIVRPNRPSPGGFVVENNESIFYVAPWDIITKI